MGLLLYLAVVLLISLIILWISNAIVFWIAGRIVSGMNTTFTDALIVAFVGSLVNSILQQGFEWVFGIIGPILPGWDWLLILAISGLITLLVYIPLIMKFFDVGLGGAIAVGLLVIIFSIIIGIGIAILIVILAIVLLPLITLPGP